MSVSCHATTSGYYWTVHLEGTKRLLRKRVTEQSSWVCGILFTLFFTELWETWWGREHGRAHCQGLPVLENTLVVEGGCLSVFPIRVILHWMIGLSLLVFFTLVLDLQDWNLLFYCLLILAVNMVSSAGFFQQISTHLHEHKSGNPFA